MTRKLFSTMTLVHIAAAGCALFYAWQVSQSAYVKTGFQFITPLLVIMAVHLAWLICSKGMVAGFANLIYKRSAGSATALALTLLAGSIFAPQPAQAASGQEILNMVLVVVFCVFIIAVVAAVIALVCYAVFKSVKAIYRQFQPSDDNTPDSRLFDIGSLVVTASFLAIASFEGHPKFYAFATDNRSTSSHYVDAPPTKVWATMQTATSPKFPLPAMLGFFPQPVDVVTDEGTNLGSMRRVAFEGREGAGHLTLKVVERTATRARFEVQSDTSPFANWIAHRNLTYTVTPEGTGTRLEVSLDYNRLLAPSWFFTPLTNGAAYLAMDVLARDVKTRATR